MGSAVYRLLEVNRLLNSVLAFQHLVELLKLCLDELVVFVSHGAELAGGLTQVVVIVILLARQGLNKLVAEALHAPRLIEFPDRIVLAWPLDPASALERHVHRLERISDQRRLKSGP